jgi:hypothetical protein
MTPNFPPAYPDSDSFTTAVNAAALLPYHLEVENRPGLPELPAGDAR